MKRIRFPLLVVFALSIRLTLGSEAPALIDRPNADSGPTQISVGIWVADISNIDSAQHRTLSKSIPMARLLLGNVTPEPSRNRCDCNHSRSIGKLFASSWSRFGISPTK